MIRQLAEMRPEQSKINGNGRSHSENEFPLADFNENWQYFLNTFYHIWFCIVYLPSLSCPRKIINLLEISLSMNLKKLYQKTEVKWFKLTTEINPVLRWFRQKELNIPHFLCGMEKRIICFYLLKKW